jgi:hypothetical protein
LAIDLTAQHSGEPRRFVSRLPDYRTRLDNLLVDVHLTFCQACDCAIKEHLDVQRLELPKRTLEEFRIERRKNTGGRFDQNDSGGCRFYVTEVPAKCKASQL